MNYTTAETNWHVYLEIHQLGANAYLILRTWSSLIWFSSSFRFWIVLETVGIQSEGHPIVLLANDLLQYANKPKSKNDAGQ